MKASNKLFVIESIDRLSFIESKIGGKLQVAHKMKNEAHFELPKVSG
jgi:hypothetical protein